MKYLKIYILVISFFAAIFFSIFKLIESPPVWMDEGIIIQTARTFANIGYPAVPVAPNVYESAGTITTSYPVTLPVAISFRIFGVGLFYARIVMVAYLFLLFGLVYFLLKKFVSPIKYALAFALVATFAPIYGQGKNVLGEVPGMFFFISFLVSIYFYEKYNYLDTRIAVVSGLLGGLFVSTKPIFILFLPALFISFLIKKMWYKDIKIDIKAFAIFFVSLLLPILIWFGIQFKGDSFSDILSIYANPYKVDISKMVIQNIRLFYTDFQPIYFLFMFVVWSLSVFIRLYKKEIISFGELIAFLFSTLVFFAFLRTFGYYRYFFPAQLLALIYFTPSLEGILPRFNLSTKFKTDLFSLICVLVLILVQSYSLLFTSWTAKSFSSNKTKIMNEYFSHINVDSLFLYQAPEVATFLRGSSFYQFFYTAPQVSFGKQYIKVLKEGIPNTVIVNSDVYKKNLDVFKSYTKVEKVDKYSILRK